MKKLIFLSLILFLNLYFFCLAEQNNFYPQTLINKHKQLKKAIKQRNLKKVIELVQQNDSQLFNNKKLFALALKKFKTNKACMNDSGFFEDLLYSLIPACFITPYVLFYHFYKNTATPLSLPHVMLILHGTTIASIILSLSASVGCLILHLSKITACKESKMIYKILRKYTLAHEAGGFNA